MRSDERAVSDTLGFVFVFGIIIVTVGIVYVGGFGSLDDARQFERMNNAERAFEVLADNVEDLTQRGAPSRATEIKLAEASLEQRAADSIEVNVSHAGDPSKFQNRSVEYQPLVYQSRTQTSDEVVYAMGATFRTSAGGTAMMEEPAMVFRDVDGDGSVDRAIVPIVQTRYGGGANITGSQTVLVRTELARQSVALSNTAAGTDYDVTINVSSDRADPWRQHLEDAADADCTDPANGDRFASCDVDGVQEVYVVVFTVDVEIGR